MIAIDVQSRKPIYEQIVERFETLIVSGVLAPDSQLPSVRALAMELSINPNTIQKAYTMLEQEGFIYPVRGRGNFVSGDETLKKKKQERRFRRRRLSAGCGNIMNADRKATVTFTIRKKRREQNDRDRGRIKAV